MKTIILLRRLINEKIVASEKRARYVRQEATRFKDKAKVFKAFPDPDPDATRYYAGLAAEYEDKARKEKLAIEEWKIVLADTEEVFKEVGQ